MDTCTHCPQKPHYTVPMTGEDDSVDLKPGVNDWWTGW